jgi:glycerophosphoryl diester phosphodiesterase
MQVIAHRGASGHRPENTLPAYELAIEMASDMIEIDLHLTRDGEIVITHDADLPGLGEIGDATSEQVRAIDAGQGERIPTLDEVLDGFAKRIPFNLEIKWGASGDYQGLEARTLEALAARGLGLEILFSSFRLSVLRRLREQDPSARLALLVSPEDQSFSLDEALDRAVELGCEALNPHWVQANSELVERAHGAGLLVNVYTVNETAGMRRMLELGIDGVFTNFPDLLRGLLDSAA